MLREKKLGPSFANFDRGLINTLTVKLKRDSSYWMSLWLEPRDTNATEVGVDAWISAGKPDTPDGIRLPSDGKLEQSILKALRAALPSP